MDHELENTARQRHEDYIRKIPGPDPSAYNPNTSHKEKEFPCGVVSSAVLIDATIKYPYPPTSLPKKEYIEKALNT